MIATPDMTKETFRQNRTVIAPASGKAYRTVSTLFSSRTSTIRILRTTDTKRRSST